MQVQNNKIAFSTIFQNEIQIDISPEICSPIRKRRIRSSHRCSIPPIARCLFTRSRVYRGQERNFHGGRDIFPFACHSHPSPTFPFASDSPLSTDYIKDSTRMPPQILGETPLPPRRSLRLASALRRAKRPHSPHSILSFVPRKNASRCA